jgi:hypothetical protein
VRLRWCAGADGLARVCLSACLPVCLWRCRPRCTRQVDKFLLVTVTPPPALLEGWEAMLSTGTGETYYFHAGSGESTYEVPGGGGARPPFRFCVPYAERADWMEALEGVGQPPSEWVAEAVAAKEQAEAEVAEAIAAKEREDIAVAEGVVAVQEARRAELTAELTELRGQLEGATEGGVGAGTTLQQEVAAKEAALTEIEGALRDAQANLQREIEESQAADLVVREQRW